MWPRSRLSNKVRHPRTKFPYLCTMNALRPARSRMPTSAACIARRAAAASRDLCRRQSSTSWRRSWSRPREAVTMSQSAWSRHVSARGSTSKRLIARAEGSGSKKRKSSSAAPGRGDEGKPMAWQHSTNSPSSRRLDPSVSSPSRHALSMFPYLAQSRPFHSAIMAAASASTWCKEMVGSMPGRCLELLGASAGHPASRLPPPSSSHSLRKSPTKPSLRTRMKKSSLPTWSRP